MSFLSSIVSIFAKEVSAQVIKEVKAFLKQSADIKEKVTLRDQEALELKEDIRLAQTDEERDVLLDKMDSLLRRTFKPD